MTAAALIPLGIFAILLLLVVLAIFGLAKAKSDQHEEDEATVWIVNPHSMASPSPVEAPPAANVIRMPVRLHVVKGGRQ